MRLSIIPVEGGVSVALQTTRQHTAICRTSSPAVDILAGIDQVLAELQRIYYHAVQIPVALQSDVMEEVVNGAPQFIALRRKDAVDESTP